MLKLEDVCENYKVQIQACCSIVCLLFKLISHSDLIYVPYRTVTNNLISSLSNSNIN